MAMGSEANSHVLATMILKMWAVEHAACLDECLEEQSTGIDDANVNGHGRPDGRRSQRLAEWQDFWQDFRRLCLRFARWTYQGDDRAPSSSDPVLDASPLWLLAVITPVLGLSDELWNAIALLRDQWRSESGEPGATGGVVETHDRYACRDSRLTRKSQSAGETGERGMSDVIVCILRNVLSELKRIGRREGTSSFRELLTEPLTLIRIGQFFFYHRNQVKSQVLSKCPNEPDGRRYRIGMPYMPLAYFLDAISTAPLLTKRDGQVRPHRRRRAHRRRNTHAS